MSNSLLWLVVKSTYSRS